MKILPALAAFFISTAALAAPKAFDLWPAKNGDAPTTYIKTAPAFVPTGKAWKFAHGAKVDVKIDASKTLRSITPYYFGTNASWWSGKTWFMDADRIEKAKQSGIKFWRWPGGSSSDNYHWDDNYGTHTKEHDGGDATRMTKPGMVLTDDFIDFCRQTGSEAIFTANYAAARYMDVKYAADMAARWVKYCNFEKKFKVSYWEVGNENYGNWEEGSKMEGKPLLSGDVYGKDFRVISDAMKKVDPSIYVGAVGVDTDNGEEWTGFFWWMKGLLPELKGKADYLILHQYFMWPFDSANQYTKPSNEVIFGNLHKLGDARTAVDQMLTKYASTEMGLPVALTEFNILNANGPPTISLMNGLFTTEVIGESIRTGYATCNYWDWKNGLDTKLGGGDHAMLSDGDPAIPNGTPRPSYYAYSLCTRAFGDKLVQSDSSDPTVKVYASRFAGGEMGLVIVNENAQNRTIKLDLSGFTPNGKLMGWVLTGKGLNERQVSWNGEMGPDGGGGPFPIDPIAPYHGSFKTAEPLQLPVQANSVTGVILY